MSSPTEYEITVRSTDMDADQVVNNARYFEYLEQARLHHLKQIGVLGAPGDLRGPAPSFAIAETSCVYRAPLVYGDVVVVRVSTTDVRNRSFTLGYEMVMKHDGRPVADGSSAQVWLDADGQPSPLPPGVREALQRSCVSDGT